MVILITGGSGFIGSALIRNLINNTNHRVVNIDKLTYAGNQESLCGTASSGRYSFEQIDICDPLKIINIIQSYQPSAIIHLAAESHVDRSIDNPDEFIKTNIVGTYNLLSQATHYWKNYCSDKERFRFIHISTDEVFGDLGDEGFFTEKTSYSPNSPYSASKAGSDHLVRAWYKTYSLPAIITNCSNNYGPYQFPEKFIPHMILNALKGSPLPLYGDGQQIRDWLYVDDHVSALLDVLARGQIGETYNIGGHNEQKNIDVAEIICEALEEYAHDRKPQNISNYRDLITFVSDRPGHDRRYAIDASKIEHDLGWRPLENFESALKKTVQWYLGNEVWWERVLSGEYRLDRIGNNDKD